MKKGLKSIGVLAIGLATMMNLTSCSLFESDTTYKYQESADVIEVQNTVSQLVDKVGSACIGVQAIYANNSGATGSGVIYKKVGNKYYAITNYHVIEDGQTIRAYVNDSIYITATVEATYERHDLACISFEAADKYNIGVVDITGEIPVINPGQTVVAIGCPLGLSNFNYVTVGVVSSGVVVSGSASGSTATGVNMFFHDASINSGNSGGALFDLEGHLLGINFRKIVKDSDNNLVEGMGEAIYIEEVLNFLESSELL